MTTTTITGFAFDSNYNTDATSNVKSSVELQITAFSGETFSYSIDSTPPDDIPNVTLVLDVDDIYGITIDGSPIDPSSTAKIGTVTWGGGNETVVLSIEVPDTSPSTDTSYVFRLAGDPLPAINTVADFEALDSSITGIAPASTPYAEGESIAFEDFPTAQVTEADFIDGTPGPDTLVGGDGMDTILGNGGADLIFGGNGSDQLLGGGGNDTINPGENNGFGDGIQAGRGSDTIDFAGIFQGFVILNHDDLTGPITVDIDGDANTGSISTASQGTDTLLNVANPLNAGATTGGLSILGTTGNDTFNMHVVGNQWADVRGGDGDDTINITGDGFVRLSYNSGGAVNADLSTGLIMQDGFTDTVNGNAWELRGSDANDTLTGSSNNESFIGQGGNDAIDGGGGFDRVRYDRGGNDSAVNVDLGAGTATGTWNGNAFTDTLSNIEWVRGTGFGDTLTGDGADNFLEGRGGNDSLHGGDGADTLIGGAGNDTINPGENDGSGDAIEAATGNDTIDFADIVQGFVTLYHNDLTGPITVDIDGDANTGSISTASQGTDTLLNVANPLNAGWTTGGLSILGTTGNDTFNMDVVGNQWADVRGGDGDDTINITGDGFVRLSYTGGTGGGSVNANLSTGTIQQDGFTDTVNGNAWELRASDADDTLVGSENDESFIGQGGNDVIDGGGGFDRVRYDRNGNDSAVNVDLGAGTATGTWNGNAFTDMLNNIEWVRGTGFGDTLTGDGAGNLLEGEVGNDVLRGRRGGDTLEGGDGRDELRGDGGRDALLGEKGNDTLKGGGGNDTLEGNTGGDRLLGNGGDDMLKGGGQNDNLFGQVGNDTLLGGGGEDALNGADGIDRIKGGAGDDVIDGGNHNDRLFGGGGNDAIRGGGGRDKLVGQKGHDQLAGENGWDVLKGGQGRDTIEGHKGNDRLFGNAGNDLLKGGGQDDRLLGGAGNDRLRGGAGDDTVRGDGGDDVLEGGLGADTFLFNANAESGSDSINGFQNGTDQIRLTGSVGFGDLTIAQAGGDTVITWDTGAVTLTGETGVIDENDFLFG